MDDRLNEYQHLWKDGHHGNWVLVGTLPSVLIRNRLSRSVVLIEDDELYESVIRKMLEAGVPVVASL